MHVHVDQLEQTPSAETGGMHMRGLVRLSAETDRVYTINLGKVLLSADNRRAKRAINMIREFARHHMGISEVKIDMDVSRIIWSKGIRHPPRKIRVHMHKTDEGNILISKYEEEPTASSDTQPKLSGAKKSTDSASDKLEDAKPDVKAKPADTKKSTDVASDKPKAASKPADTKPEAKSKPADTKKSTGAASDKPKAKPADTKPEAKSKPSDAKKSTSSASDKPKAASKPAEAKAKPADTKKSTGADKESKTTS